MRWDNLKEGSEGQRRLPGYRDGAVIRHFDAPEALQTRFYEVKARSVLNRVPPRSRMPFRWTINPYRGCSHACVYCLGPHTRVLMADGQSRRIADVQVGDSIYGTVEDGEKRRYAVTKVLDKWSSIKQAKAVVLVDGTELVASGMHRFLTDRGWKHVTGSENGSFEPPHLMLGDELVGLNSGLDPQTGALERPLLGDRAQPSPELRVCSVRPLGRAMRMYDISTGTEDFIAEGVVSHNCFARPTHAYLGFDTGRDFEKEIVVKVNAPEVLRVELARPSWKGEHVAMGTNTDPYQWVEGRYRLMEGIWEALRDVGNPCSVLTKSPLLLRDLRVMLEISKRAQISACLSIPTLDEKAWRETEPHTPHPRARLEAVAELNRSGIPTGVLVAPLMPGINDAPKQVEPLLQEAVDAGAAHIGGVALHLRTGVKEVFMDWLGNARPELAGRYETLYGRGAYAPREERERLRGLVRSGSAGRSGFGRYRFGLPQREATARETTARETTARQATQTTAGEATAGELAAREASRRKPAVRQQSLF